MKSSFLSLLLLLFADCAAETGAGKCELLHGGLGSIRLDVTSKQVERILGRKIPLNFAGDTQAGTTIETVRDLRSIGLSAKSQLAITGVDVIFDTTKENQPTVKFLAYGVACEDVDKMQRRCGGVTYPDGGNNWKIFSRDVSLAVGGGKNPCHVWVRRIKNKN